MKTIKIVCGVIITLFAMQMNAQEMNTEQIKNQTGLMNATVTHTLAYIKDGVERPYEVTVRERRTSVAKFDKTDLGKVDQKRIPTPENVAVLVTISNPANTSDDRVVSMRYDKKVNDTFRLESNSQGFTIHVDEHRMKYTMGVGISFQNPLDKNYFQAEEFDVIK